MTTPYVSNIPLRLKPLNNRAPHDVEIVRNNHNTLTMAILKKERKSPLLERVLRHEEVDFAELSLHEIKKLVSDLVELQENRIKKEEILKLQNIVIKASEKIRDILNTEK